MEKIRILIADDHNFIIDGIIAMLKNDENISVIGTANNGKEAVELNDLLNPDIIIMDISMPVLSGIEATRHILSGNPTAKVIALTQHEDNEYILQFIKAGGMGYLLKTSKKHEFVEAIRIVHRGEKYLSKTVSNIMLDNLMLSQKSDSSEKDSKILLTTREVEIIRLIANDLTNNEIADKLFISLRTVETHRRNLMQKLNVKTVVSLIRYAIKNDIIKIDEIINKSSKD